mmetsp:Transcript_24928/g.34348  ORF Transcript_24928/g.34348 Transcript_24928/m.34348 type:complete len:253 (-) Transcript_24928:70-828(-)
MRQEFHKAKKEKIKEVEAAHASLATARDKMNLEQQQHQEYDTEREKVGCESSSPLKRWREQEEEVEVFEHRTRSQQKNGVKRTKMSSILHQFGTGKKPLKASRKALRMDGGDPKVDNHPGPPVLGNWTACKQVMSAKVLNIDGSMFRKWKHTNQHIYNQDVKEHVSTSVDVDRKKNIESKEDDKNENISNSLKSSDYFTHLPDDINKEVDFPLLHSTNSEQPCSENVHVKTTLTSSLREKKSINVLNRKSFS